MISSNRMNVRIILILAFHNVIKEKVENDTWTYEEKLILIQAVQKHGENWDEILKVNY
jgi:hypothetical protein